MESPPKILLRFFKWICDPEIHANVEGDLLELYKERRLESGKKRANLRFAFDVFLLIRPEIINPFKIYRTNSSSGIFKSYFQITFRNLKKNPAYSLLNIIGLSLGMAAFLFLIQYISFEKSYDKFHENYENI